MKAHPFRKARTMGTIWIVLPNIVAFDRISQYETPFTRVYLSNGEVHEVGETPENIAAVLAEAGGAE